MNIKKTLERREYLKEWRNKRRHKLKKEHRCIWCKKKVEKVITYPQFCKEHSQKNRKQKKKLIMGVLFLLLSIFGYVLLYALWSSI